MTRLVGSYLRHVNIRIMIIIVIWIKQRTAVESPMKLISKDGATHLIPLNVVSSLCSEALLQYVIVLHVITQ